jgi:hypothetical protein
MIDQLSVETMRTTERLARSRQELVDLFTIVRHQGGSVASDAEFPRSHTIRLLMHSQSLRALAVLAAGMLVARPLTAWRLLRALPLGALARSLLTRIFNSTGTSR